MEGQSGAHMDSGVSSTTEDAQEVQEVQVTGSHRDVETVITVESIKEEDMIPHRKPAPVAKTPDRRDIVRIIPKLPNQDLTIKRIIIKSPIKDVHIQKPVQNIPPIVEEAQKPTSKDKPVNKTPQPSVSHQVIVSEEATNKKEKEQSPKKDNAEKNMQNNSITSSDVQKPSQTSPAKDSESQESTSTIETATKTVPSKEQQALAKELGLRVVTVKDQLAKHSAVKELTTKVSAGKGYPIKVVPIKETPPKPTPGKEILPKATPGKETPPKPTPSKETLPVPTTDKESLSKPTPGKETLPKPTENKEIPPKPTLGKETPLKPTLGKETPSKPTPGKETPSKPTPGKETPSKPTPSKETPSKTLQNKEQLEKTVQPKELPTATEKIEEKQDENDTKPAEPESKTKLILTMEDKEASNDSQLETGSEASEKEHNRSISRELRSLINSAKESKIISECTQLTSKTRKSRTPLDTSSTNLNVSVEADKIQGVRRSSNNSQISNCSEKSDKTVVKRSMRSQNPEFVSKVKNFLNSVSGKVQKTQELSDDESEEKNKESEKELTPVPKKKKMEEEVAEVSKKLRSDSYCWRCHWAVEPAANEKGAIHPPMQCSVCPRAFHFKCLTSPERSKINTEKSWVCPECLLILQAESSETRSPAMKKISLGMLCDLLKHALDRMMEVNGVEPFTTPVDRTMFPDYDKYVVHPMDLGRMREHINEGLYGSTEAFIADAQWILHNSIIFNTLQAKLTGGARALVRSCRAEMSEIEACPECYAAAHARRPTWFTDVCTTPHILLWAKLKGFPYWPAKGMSVNSSGLVDVRFFGAHDRAWVPARDCFLYSEKDPNNFRTKRQDILDSMQEAEQHIRNISRKYGKFVYPPFKTPFDPTKLYEQLKLMIPSFEGEVRTPLKDKSSNSSPSFTMKEKSRSNSKSSKGSMIDGYISDGDDTAVTSRKMADGAVIAREEEDLHTLDKDNKETLMEVEIPQAKENETSRKRRRSDLEEAVITIIDTGREKRKRIESADEKKDLKKPDGKESKEHKLKEITAKSKDEPSTSTGDKKGSKIAPVRVISIAKVMKQTQTPPKVSSDKEEDKTPNTKQKARLVKSNSIDKEKLTPQEEKKSQKRRNSKNKSLNNSNAGKTDKTSEKKNEKSEKKNEKPTDATNKEKAKDNAANKSISSEIEIASTSSTDSANSSRDRLQFDDDISLAVIAREVKNNPSGLPTISSVRSLSTAQTANNSAKSIEVTVEANSDSSIFTPTSTENVKNMKEAVNKLQKLRGENDPPPQVGRVGVRAFARMTSPPDKETRPNDVQIEIKAEPMDFEESDRQLQEKMDLMSAFKLRPVNPQANLRDVRINKVVVTPVTRKSAAPAMPSSVRAKKTFPQPKKADEGRSELTSKNSMVYIPIQPPMTQAPVRPVRPGTVTVTAQTGPRVPTPHTTNTSVNNSVVNTITTPLVAGPVATFSSPTTSTSATASNTSTPGAGPTVGQVPTTVHTMPLITSVNGQWTFSLQPVLSVGGVDGTPSPPIMNGLGDRPTLVPIAPAPATLAATAATQLASSRTNNDSQPPGEPPRLQQRPSLMHPLDANAPMGNVPPPSTVGPLTAKLNQNAVKLTDFFRTLLEESLEKLDDPGAHLTALKLQLEQVQWRHQQEISEIRHNHELALAEMRSSFEKEKVRLIAETRRQTQVELDAAVKHAKSKQWCANCNQEAQFYCCWNTSYCDYPCQRAHWAHHYAVCTQQRSQQDNSNSENANSPDRIPPPPETLPKTTAAPNLTVGGKLAPSRVYTQEQHPQKSSIIVSMMDDGNGNSTMKCLGTYKQPVPTQMSPLILNKQIMNSEEASKKVVTSGGYLIVGATSSAPNTTTITTARRAHAIQYIS